MSKRTVTDCDRCEREDIGTPRKVRVPYNYDPALGKTKTKGLDLCQSCLAIELGKLVRAMPTEEGKKWVEAIEKRKARQRQPTVDPEDQDPDDADEVEDLSENPPAPPVEERTPAQHLDAAGV